MRQNRGKEQSVKNVPILSLEDLKNVLEPINPDIMNMEDTELSEYDEFKDFLDIEHREYSIEIDWDQFNEQQIQALIAILFQSIGYSIENWHEADRAREDGADLIARNNKESIAIAVKIKPKNADRQQLQDLSRRKESRRIYVYIQTPAGKFRDSMGEYQEKVDFWDEKKFNDFFVNKNLGFTSSLIFDSHKISYTIREAREMLFGIRDKCLKLSRKETQKLDRQSFMFLWRLKDDAVSLHKPNKNVITLLEKPINIKSKQLNEHFVKIFLEYLDILNSSLNSFMHYFKIFYEDNEDLVHNSIIAEIGRSHWLQLLQYQTDNSLRSLQNELEEAIRDDKLLKKFRKGSPNKEEEKYWKERAKNNDVWSVMETRVRNLMIFGDGIEEIVDDIVKEHAQKYVV